MLTLKKIFEDYAISLVTAAKMDAKELQITDNGDLPACENMTYKDWIETQALVYFQDDSSAMLEDNDSFVTVIQDAIKAAL